MLEDLAERFLSLDPFLVGLVTYGLMPAGALVAALTSTSSIKLERSPYFAMSGLCGLAAGISSIPAIYFPVAVLNEFLWALLLISLLINSFVGYAYCWISMARSRDACGSASRAVLAFVPVANLWLFLAPGTTEHDGGRDRTALPFTGKTGIAIGMLAALAGLLAWHASNFATEAIIKALRWDPVWGARAHLKEIGDRGLNAVVEDWIASTKTPDRLDPMTRLVEVKREGMNFEQRYIVTPPIGASLDRLPPEVEQKVIAQTCRNPRTRALIESGMAMQHVYTTEYNRIIATVRVGPDTCNDSIL